MRWKERLSGGDEGPVMTDTDLLSALDAFVQEHRRCGELDAAAEAERVWMTCDCGGAIVRALKPLDPSG